MIKHKGGDEVPVHTGVEWYKIKGVGKEKECSKISEIHECLG